VRADAAQVDARRLFAPLGPTYDRYAALLSFGQDPRWRRALVAACALPPEGTALDVATGTAAVAIAMARRHGCRVVGVDLSPEMLAVGRERVAAAALADRIELREGRAEQLPFEDASFDAVTCTYVLRYVDDPAAAVAELARVARPGAPVGYLDFGLPPLAPARAAWELYTRWLLPGAGRLIAPGWHEVGRFLRGSITDFACRYPPPALAALFAQAGVCDVVARPLSLGGGVVVSGARR
jgi:demethylmenaquinone methyltransferase/2-methoxy-6-polyprenyl-1,4-benzoquinol methylase